MSTQNCENENSERRKDLNVSLLRHGENFVICFSQDAIPEPEDESEGTFPQILVAIAGILLLLAFL